MPFGVLLYTKAWTETLLAAEVPGNDLALLNDLIKYQSIDLNIGFAARSDGKPPMVSG